MTAAGNSIIVKSNGGSQYDPGDYYRLTLGNNGGSETVTVSYNVPSKVITIFPFGSSITAGTSAQTPYNGGGYRSQLYLDLVDDGRFIPNYVGSGTGLTATNPNEGNILTDANQLNNEGHPGWTTTQMLANLNMSDGESGNNGGYWLKPGNGENPNYITVNIGGNDAVDYGTSAAIMARGVAAVGRHRLRVQHAATGRGDDPFDHRLPGRYVSRHLQHRRTRPVLQPGDAGDCLQPRARGPERQPPRPAQHHQLHDGRRHRQHPPHPGRATTRWPTPGTQSLVYGQAYWTGSQGNVWNTVNGSSTNFDLDAG